ncbi:MAG: type II toxin-antitoxin system Phd/YefM family antitoxin [Chloroflexota bacterium]
MAIHTTYSDAQTRFAELLDKAVDDQETIVVKRRGKGDVAMIDARELASLQETVYLLRSPANARRLFDALEGLDRGEGIRVDPEAFAALAEAVERGEDKATLRDMVGRLGRAAPSPAAAPVPPAAAESEVTLATSR